MLDLDTGKCQNPSIVSWIQSFWNFKIVLRIQTDPNFTKRSLMTIKTHTIEKKNPQHNQIWEWEETPEVLEALKQLDKSSQVVEDCGKST